MAPNPCNIVFQIQRVLTVGERSVKNEMFKMIITCPHCGQKLCRAAIGSNIEICCPKCKTVYESQVDNNGGVHALPLDLKPVSKSEYKKAQGI